MTSLPHPSMMSISPLGRSHTDLSPPHTMYDHSNRPFQTMVQQPLSYPYHIPTGYQSFNYLPTPPSPFSSHFQHHHGLPNQYSPTTISPDVFNPHAYPPSNTLPTIPLRYSGMGPISIGRPVPQCVAPQDLFRLPSSQSLPSNLIGLGMFSDYSPGSGENQRLVTPDIEVEGDETLTLASPASTPKSTNGTEEEEYEMKIEEESVQETGQAVSKAKKRCPVGAIRKRSLVPATSSVKAPVSVVVTDSPGSEKAKKRSRSSQACEKCRGRKARCFGGIPCNRCIKLKHECIFTPTSKVVDPKSPKSPNKSRRHSTGVSLATRPSFPNKAHTYAPKPVVPPHPIHSAVLATPSAFPSLDLPSVNSLGMDFSSTHIHPLRPTSRSINHDDEEEDESESDSDEDSEYGMPGLTNSSSSGSSGPTSHSGSGSTGTENTTSMDSAEWTADEELFQLSPFDEVGRFEWGVGDMISFGAE